MDKILERLGLKYDDLTVAEKETLNSWTQTLDSNQLTVLAVKDFVTSLKYSVEQELSETSHNTKQDLFLKARLRNLMLLEAFLSTPQKAKQAIDRAIAGIVSNRAEGGVK